MSGILVREHEYEPIPGLPEKLPEGEFILWQGRPSAGLVSRRILKTRWIAAYFVLLAGWAVVTGFEDGRSLGSILFSAGAVAMLGAVVLALFELYAWGVQKTTLYTVTNCRIVMRAGVALSVTLNLPFSRIGSVRLNRSEDGSGDIAIALTDGTRVSWMLFWPHLRPWRFQSPEPSFRCLKNVDAIAAVLKQELTRYRNLQGVVPGPGRTPARAPVATPGVNASPEPAT